MNKWRWLKSIGNLLPRVSYNKRISVYKYLITVQEVAGFQELHSIQEHNSR